jgi:hypothetical protein
MRCVRACIESHEEHFEHLLQMYSFSCNSQITCFHTHIVVDIFCIGMWNFGTKFVRTFQLHPVDLIASDIVPSEQLVGYGLSDQRNGDRFPIGTKNFLRGRVSK